MKTSKKFADWAYRWEMQFNPDVNKQSQEAVLSIKLEKEVHSKTVFNNSPVIRSNFQKYPDIKLNFTHLFKEKLKINKTSQYYKKTTMYSAQS